MAIQRGAGMNVTLDDLHERIEIQHRDKTRDIDGNIVDGEIHTRAYSKKEIIACLRKG